MRAQWCFLYITITYVVRNVAGNPKPCLFVHSVYNEIEHFSGALEVQSFLDTQPLHCREECQQFFKEKHYWMDPQYDGSGTVPSTLFGTLHVQRLLWKLQHPADCSKAKFLLLKYPGYGFGATMHQLSKLAAIAVEQGRVFLHEPTHNGGWFHGNSYCTEERGVTWDTCYFERWSSCTIDDALQAGEVQELDTSFTIDQSDVPVLATGDPGFLSWDHVPHQFEHLLQRAQVSVNEVQVYWMLAQFSAYLLRPNENIRSSIQHVVTQLLRRGDGSHVALQDLPGGWTAVHVRRGNKWTEMQPIPEEQYASAVVEMHKVVPGISGDVVVLTESQATRQWFIQNYTQGSVYYLDTPTYEDQTTDYSEFQKHVARIGGIHVEALNTMAMIHLAVMAEGFVGSYSGHGRSNLGQLMHELRSTGAFKASAPHVEIQLGFDEQRYVHVPSFCDGPHGQPPPT